MHQIAGYEDSIITNTVAMKYPLANDLAEAEDNHLLAKNGLNKLEHKKARDNYSILSNEQIGRDMYILSIRGDFKGSPGQFYMLRGVDSFMTLSRPISIFDIEKSDLQIDGSISFLYKVCGKGTAYFSSLKKDDEIIVYGPYGRGFPVDEYKDKRVLLVGGGAGSAPLFYAAKQLKYADIKIGFNNEAMDDVQKESFLQKYSLHANASFHINEDMTKDIPEHKYDVVMSCGPEIMMKKLSEKHINTYVSLEKHMGCAVGACLSCTCEVGGKRVRVCKEGPVFRGSEVEFEH